MTNSSCSDSGLAFERRRKQERHRIDNRAHAITSNVTRVTHVDRLEDVGTSGDLEGFAGSRRVRLDSQRFELAVERAEKSLAD